MHKIIANIASIAHVASGFLDNSIAIAIAHIARSERALSEKKDIICAINPLRWKETKLGNKTLRLVQTERYER